MTTVACTFLRHDLRPRWIGPVQAAYCHTCWCLWVPDSTDRPDSPSGAGHAASPRASATGSRQAAASVVSPAP